jgi:hypothetical protein
MGTDQENTGHVIRAADLEKYVDLLVVFVHHFPGSTPAQFAQEQLKESAMGESKISEVMLQVQKEDAERQARVFMENARNAMRAVKIAIEEGNYEEAIQIIDEATGDSD